MALYFFIIELIKLTKTRNNAMHNLRDRFDKNSAIVKRSLKNLLDPDGNLPRRGKKPKFSDVEAIALSLLSESLMIDSENYLFKLLHNNYKEQFPNLIERSRFNRRRKTTSPFNREISHPYS